MMTNLEFTEEMRSILAKMKGEKFISYECVRERAMWAMCKLRINIESFSIDLYNEEVPVPGFIDGFAHDETVGKFWCSEESKDSVFNSLSSKEAHEFLINEKVIAVKVVNDHIKDKERDFEVSIDQAVLIETDKSKISFYRNWIFDEWINISVEKDDFLLQPIEEVADDWWVTEQGVEVTRTIIEL